MPTRLDKRRKTSQPGFPGNQHLEDTVAKTLTKPKPTEIAETAPKKVTFFSKSAFFQFHFWGRRARKVYGPDGDVFWDRHPRPVAKFAPRAQGLAGGGYFETSDPEEIRQLREAAKRTPDSLMEMETADQPPLDPVQAQIMGIPVVHEDEPTWGDDGDELQNPE